MQGRGDGLPGTVGDESGQPGTVGDGPAWVKTAGDWGGRPGTERVMSHDVIMIRSAIMRSTPANTCGKVSVEGYCE